MDYSAGQMVMKQNRDKLGISWRFKLECGWACSFRSANCTTQVALIYNYGGHEGCDQGVTSAATSESTATGKELQLSTAEPRRKTYE